MTTTNLILASGILSALQQFVTATKLHPILVNFTAALVPISVASDLAARFLKNQSLRNTAWWTLFYATVITPFTANTGWLFWMSDDNGVTGMTIHKWLGTGLTVLLFAHVFVKPAKEDVLQSTITGFGKVQSRPADVVSVDAPHDSIVNKVYVGAGETVKQGSAN